jgi:hypothetical protein
MPEVKNYRVLNGCHNCANMRDDASQFDEHIMVCLLRNPELRNVDEWTIYTERRDAFLDEHATCDEWQKAEEQKNE